MLRALALVGVKTPNCYFRTAHTQNHFYPEWLLLKFSTSSYSNFFNIEVTVVVLIKIKSIFYCLSLPSLSTLSILCRSISLLTLNPSLSLSLSCHYQSLSVTPYAAQPNTLASLPSLSMTIKLVVDEIRMWVG